MTTSATTGCYVHLPFCDRICPYCDFAVVKYDRSRARRYVAALLREIAESPAPRHPVRTIFLGGGTPSALEAGQVTSVLDALFETFDIARGDVECTLEANPTRSAGDLAAWRAAGVTRLSIGVQSLDDDELHRLGRDHSAAQAVGFARTARAQGFANISFDLLAGAPGQTPQTFSRSIGRAIDCGPEHVSIYGLTIEPGTPYAIWHAREPSAFPDDDAVAEMLELSDTELTRAGFRHYEISNFAKPGRECEHNVGYWRQRDCLAFGMSAAGYRDGVRYRNARDFEAYCAAIESGTSARADVEHLDFGRRVGEAAMLALRMEDGIEDDDFRRRFSIEPSVAFARARNKCSAAGLLETDGRGARLTERGRLLANEVCAEFLTPTLGTQSKAPDLNGASIT